MQFFYSNVCPFTTDRVTFSRHTIVLQVYSRFQSVTIVLHECYYDCSLFSGGGGTGIPAAGGGRGEAVERRAEEER